MKLSISAICHVFACTLIFGCSDSIEGRPGADVRDRPTLGGASGSGGNAGGAGGAQDTLPRTFAPTDPNLVYSGRILFADGKPPRFSAPGVSISARFRGVSVAAMLRDYASTANYFDAVIDEDYTNTLKIKVNPDGNPTEIVKGLPYGEHTITLVKRTEASTGQVEFNGFILEGDLLPPPERPKRKLEIIGDSISCGSGNEALDGSAACDEDYGRPYSNANKSYGAMLARALDAEVHITAVSGIGALRNYNCSDSNTMPKVYNRVFLEAANAPVWDPTHTAFVPDAILVALGTNDFSPDACQNPPLNDAYDPTNYTAFISELVGFVQTLREYYPVAEIFLTSSPMLRDGWPNGSYTSNTDQRAALSTVAETLNEGQADAGKVHLLLADFSATRIAGRGCGSHPNAFEHGIMAGVDSTKPTDTAPAELLLNPIRQVMGW